MSKSFVFKNIDNEGREILNVVSEAHQFNRWMYESVKPFCTSPILEIGSGIGNISNQFLQNNYDIYLSDIRKNYLSYLQQQFDHFPTLRGILHMDIIDSDFDEKFGHLFNSFSTVYALNILEHVEDDVQAIANCKKLLQPGGQLIILVPAYQKLYNTFDEQLMHYRRYTLVQLKNLFDKNKLHIEHEQYFNFVGMFGWWLNGNVLRKKTLPGGQMKLYNTLVPMIKLIDKLIFNTMGLSAICVGRKK